MSSSKGFGLAIFAVVCLLGETGGPAHAQRYALTDLGPGVALGLNDAGQVVGYSYFAGNPNSVATLRSDGVTTDLGTLPGWTDSFATSINDAGTVVGYSGPVSPNSNFFNGIAANFPVSSFYGRATLWSGGAIKDLGTLSGAVGSIADGINNASQVLGYSTFLDSVCCGGTPHATLLSGGTVTDLSKLPGGPIHGLPGPYYATANNNAGQVVGATSIGYAWLSSGSALTYLPGLGYPTGINDVGQVVGVVGAQPQFNFTVATLWENSTVTQLGVLPGTAGSAALGINDSGEVVGYSYRGDCCTFATLWSGGVITNLTDALYSGGNGWTLEEATAINDAGQIVGFGEGPGGESAFLLTPVRVPEPSTWAMMLLGFTGLAFAGHGRARAGRAALARQLG